MKVNILLANFAILAKFSTQNYFSCRVRSEIIETGAEKEKEAAQRSSILPGRENVAVMERGQLSSDYALFPSHFPATISNRKSGTLTLNQLHNRKKNRKLNIAP